MTRDYTPADRLLSALGHGLSRLGSLQGADRGARRRDNPAAPTPDAPMAEPQRRHAAGLMRINHAGEVAAQALYQGQALVARNPRVREHLLAAAREEEDHLRWCEQRLQELGAQPSRLQPLWHAGSFAIGAAAGLAGDRWSLGFIDETERQVSDHLGDHLRRLPEQDQRSRAIVSAMRDDEDRHAQEARDAGGQPLPRPVRALMRQAARVMKFGAYRV